MLLSNIIFQQKKTFNTTHMVFFITDLLIDFHTRIKNTKKNNFIVFYVFNNSHYYSHSLLWFFFTFKAIFLSILINLLLIMQSK